MDAFGELPVRPAAFLLPDKEKARNFSLYPVMACDQYTSQKEIWERADALVGGAPSALRLIIPEAYLSESERRVPLIRAAMRDYLSRGVLKEALHGMALVARKTQSGTRLGLVCVIDLNAYSFEKGAKCPIRPTEGTILSRIPPRLAVRRDAEIELSHVMLLTDDAARRLIEPLYARRSDLRPLYDTDLMLGGGHIAAWAVESREDLGAVAEAVKAIQSEKSADDILFAVGDGNHSLATAKAHWQSVAAALPQGEDSEHPARYAMVEIVNLYDEALAFEPIHRVIFDLPREALLSLLAGEGIVPCEGGGDMTLATGEGDLPMRIARPTHSLPVGSLQNALDRHSLSIDYVHGEDAVRQIVRKGGAAGALLPAMDKRALFPSVERDGALPRKTFSMGEANEKRYYIEARKII